MSFLALHCTSWYFKSFYVVLITTFVIGYAYSSARYLSMEYGNLYSYEVDFLFFYSYTTIVNRFYYQFTLSQ